jgi:excisionase family DNA binding protein
VRSPSVEVDALLKPSEVAAILYVDPKTVTRWAMAGKISSIRTPGGHRRFLRSEILALATAVGSRDRVPRRPTDHQDHAAEHQLAPVPEDGLLAVDTVARDVALAREVQRLETAADVVSERRAVEVAAGIVAEAADEARARRAAAASSAAETVARSAGRTAAAMQSQADASATTLREATVQAASVVKGAHHSTGDHAVALTALHLAAAAQAAAVIAAQDTAAAAVVAAAAVAEAAAEVARTVSDLDLAIEGEVAEVAAAIQARAASTARQVATEREARAKRVALAASDAAAAASLQTQDDLAPLGAGHDGAPHRGGAEEPDGRPRFR